jgi:2-polyprenyl-6-methoxyphenol hydroxylase-like FAD-dependent oxidoreductase
MGCVTGVGRSTIAAMKKKLSVAIIGAGMGGLASAAALRRVGIDVTVYEQAPRFTRLGAGIQIGCNAMRVLRVLGLESRLRAEAFYPRSWNNKVWRTGEVRFDMIFGESAEEKFGAPYLLAHRGDLHAALASVVPAECIRLSHAAVLSRCLDAVEREGIAEALRRFEVTRKERTSRVQLTSRTNTWLKDRTDADWVYAYDAWAVPLAS